VLSGTPGREINPHALAPAQFYIPQTHLDEHACQRRCLLLACAAFIAYDVLAFRPAWSGNLSTQAQIIGSNSVSALLFNDPQSAENTLSALKAAHNILSLGSIPPMASSLPPIPAIPVATCRRFLRCLPANWKFIGSRTRRSFWSAPLYSRQANRDSLHPVGSAGIGQQSEEVCGHCRHRFVRVPRGGSSYFFDLSQSGGRAIIRLAGGCKSGLS